MSPNGTTGQINIFFQAADADRSVVRLCSLVQATAKSAIRGAVILSQRKWSGNAFAVKQLAGAAQGFLPVGDRIVNGVDLQNFERNGLRLRTISDIM